LALANQIVLNKISSREEKNNSMWS